MLAWAEVLASVVAAPLLMFPGYYSLLGLVALPAVWLWRLIARRKTLRSTPADWPIVGLLLMTSLSLVPSADHALSRPKLYGLILGVYVFTLVVEHLRPERALTRIGPVLLVGGLAIALAGLVGTEWETDEDKAELLASVYTRLPRLVSEVPTSFGTLAGGFQPNEVGGTLALMLPFALGVVAFSSGWWRMPALGAGVVMLGVLLLTQSRSAIVATALSILLIGTLRWPSRWLALVLIAIVGLPLAIWRPGPEQLLSLALDAINATGSGPHKRFDIWGRALEMIRDFPWTGIGLNTFPVVVERSYPIFSIRTDRVLPHAHNLFLQVALDLGLPGLAAFVALLVAVGSRLVRGWRESLGSSKGLVVGVAGGLFGHFLFSLTDAITLGAKPGLLLWIMLGVAVTVGNRAHSDPLRSIISCRRPNLGLVVVRASQLVLFAVLCVQGILILPGISA